jgi:CheY-like chemotaxis protein
LQQLAARTPVVLTTAWTSESQLAALAGLGLGAALHVVPKPYDLDDLLAAVQGAVAAHRRTMGGHATDDP